MGLHYIYENGVVKEASLDEWCVFVECCERHLCETMVGDIIWVSTVFLGLDHRFGRGAPVLWETLVFDYILVQARQQAMAGRLSSEDLPKSNLLGELDSAGCRYRTDEEARKGHLVMVERVREFYPTLPVTHKVCECGKRGENYDLKACQIHEAFKNANE